MRQEMDFEAFKAITKLGYHPVYSSFAKNTGLSKIIDIDLICEWRLEEGKVKFIKIPFNTREELIQIIDHLTECHNSLQDAISNCRKKLEKEIYNFGFNGLFKE